jgi:VWFA-related protein
MANGDTRHGGGTKTTKATKIAKNARWAFLVIVAVFAILVSPPWRVSQHAQQPPPSRPAATQQRPVFRAGAHYVRVDAYPAGSDGRILEGLTRDDFEVYEDGTLQSIESFEYIAFPSWTPEAERNDPRSQEEGFALAADPAYRVFAVVIDREAFDLPGWHVMHGPLIDFLERTLGPRDLFGLVDSKSEWTDFVLGQRTTTARVELNNPAWWQKKDDYDDYEWQLVSCGLEPLIPTARADRTYSLLEGLVRLFTALRDERKSIIYVSDGMPTFRGAWRASGNPRGPEIPKIGVTPGGRLGPMPRDVVGAGASSAFCNNERMRLASVDFNYRYRELLKAGRAGNVAFYPISPLGLQGYEFTKEGNVDLAGHRNRQASTDTLVSLANETDGLAIVNTNNLRAGLTRISNDLQAYYVLGYYTTNTRWDGGLRSIKVKLKPNRAAGAKAGTIRARRQYRAPTLAEITAMTTALAAPAAAKPAAPIPPTLVAGPAAFVIRGKAAAEPADVMRLTRTDRVRLEWQVKGPLDRRTARILDRNGKPLAIDVPVTEQDDRLIVELPLAPFARGDYTVELTIGSGSIVERSPLALRIQ